MATVVITIAGDTKTVRAGSLHLSKAANGRATASFVVESTDGTYRPAIDAEVVITENGTTIFGGLIDRPREKGIVGGAKPAISTAISAYDYHAYAERRYVNDSFAEQTLKARLTALVDDYLDGYGVTLHGSQVDGPTLPAVEYKYRQLSEVLNETMTLTAESGDPYVWKIDASKVLRAYQPSTTAAPFNITGDPPYANVIGDIEVEETRQHYANRIIVKIPSKTVPDHIETFTGDGSTDAFELTSGWTVLETRGYIENGTGVYETLTTPEFAGTATWEYDADTRTLTRVAGAPTNGNSINFTFNGEFSGEGIAEDAAEIAAHGIWEKVFLVESVPEDATAQSLADSYLAKSLYAAKTVKYKTHTAAVEPGQSQTITVARRDLDVTAVITDVVIRDLGKDILERTVTAVVDDAQTNLDRGWRDVYKMWAGDKTGGANVAPVATPGGGSPAPVGPSLPDKSVQFNDGNRFGGHANFTFDKTTTTVMIGSGHTVN